MFVFHKQFSCLNKHLGYKKTKQIDSDDGFQKAESATLLAQVGATSKHLSPGASQGTHRHILAF